MDAQKRDDFRKRYLAVDTSNVSDVLDDLGFSNQGLAPAYAQRAPGCAKLAGWAYTIHGEMAAYPLGGDAEKMMACDGLRPGDVGVWSGDARGVCCFGELIALGMKEHGCVGALVDGGVRDVRWLAEHQFPVFAKYHSAVQSIGRWKVKAWQVAVKMRGATAEFVTVKPGDFILGDHDGVVVVPMAIAEQVLLKAEALTSKEDEIRDSLASGMTLQAALTRFGHV